MGETSLRINGLLQLAENPLGNPLGAGILVEHGISLLVHQLVQVAVIQAAADFPQVPLQNGEVKEHSAPIQLRSPHVSKNLVIVAVEILALAVIILQKMGRRKAGLYSHLKHGGQYSIGRANGKGEGTWPVKLPTSPCRSFAHRHCWWSGTGFRGLFFRLVQLEDDEQQDGEVHCHQAQDEQRHGKGLRGHADENQHRGAEDNGGAASCHQVVGGGCLVFWVDFPHQQYAGANRSRQHAEHGQEPFVFVALVNPAADKFQVEIGDDCSAGDGEGKGQPQL